MTELYLSVIIPCLNEEARLGRTLEQIVDYLRRQKYSGEIIVVDDGSQDRTVAVAREKLSGVPSQILETGRNQGKGEAVKRGMLTAGGQYLLFTDADLSTPIGEVEHLIGYLKDGCDIAIGSRGLPGSRVEIRQNFIREMMGRTFNRFARLLSFRQIRDSQCGFKCFRNAVAKNLFQAQKIKGFSFDAEILYLAQKRGYRIAEVPVIWRNSRNSRVDMVKDSFQMLVDLVKIRWFHR